MTNERKHKRGKVFKGEVPFELLITYLRLNRIVVNQRY